MLASKELILPQDVPLSTPANTLAVEVARARGGAVCKAVFVGSEGMTELYAARPFVPGDSGDRTSHEEALYSLGLFCKHASEHPARFPVFSRINHAHLYADSIMHVAQVITGGRPLIVCHSLKIGEAILDGSILQEGYGSNVSAGDLVRVNPAWPDRSIAGLLYSLESLGCRSLVSAITKHLEHDMPSIESAVLEFVVSPSDRAWMPVLAM